MKLDFTNFEPTKSSEENSVCSKYWKKRVCWVKNNPKKVRFIKTSMRRRLRKKGKLICLNYKETC